MISENVKESSKILSKEGNLYPKIEIIDDTVFRISYQSTPINETFDFQYQDGQWFLSAVEIVGPSEKITCQKTDAGLQFDIPSRFSCIVPNISFFYKISIIFNRLNFNIIVKAHYFFYFFIFFTTKYSSINFTCFTCTTNN